MVFVMPLNPGGTAVSIVPFFGAVFYFYKISLKEKGVFEQCAKKFPPLDFVPREKEVLEFWKANGIFEKSVEQSKGKPAYTFYDGPPTANGRPHIGHVLTRSTKDIIPRYRTMKRL